MTETLSLISILSTIELKLNGALAASNNPKNFSDQIYAKEEDKRYVTQNRLSKMLDHEMDLLEKRISRKK